MRRAAYQPRRIDEVAGALLVHVHRGVGERPGHVADAAGVVEMDVGDCDPASSSGATLSSASAASSAATDDWLPVSTSTGSVPSIE